MAPIKSISKITLPPTTEFTSSPAFWIFFVTMSDLPIESRPVITKNKVNIPVAKKIPDAIKFPNIKGYSLPEILSVLRGFLKRERPGIL